MNVLSYCSLAKHTGCVENVFSMIDRLTDDPHLDSDNFQVVKTDNCPTLNSIINYNNLVLED